MSSSRTRSRTMIGLSTVLVLAISGASMGASPVRAETVAARSQTVTAFGLFGTVENRLPSSYTVKVARFLSGGAGKCKVWNSSGGNDGSASVVRATWSCNVRWLPSGKATDTEFGWTYDADGVMIESNYIYQNGSWAQSPPAFMWTRFHDYSRVICELDYHKRPHCYTA
ncbi:hypothetical protein ACQP25_32785 [Microtetraspora malaysiensis]|uniref:hypothetical protein n=1 Tax=Microtetraspora malaysiensis TaxID=161358 RepID=UPI003D913C52